MWGFLCENVEMARMRERQGDFFRRTDISRHCGVRGLLELYGVDDRGEIENVHLSVALHESMQQVYDEVRQTAELPATWNDAVAALRTGE
ncbi:unnamed protein product [Phaeothamnion confervicola]